MPQTKVTSADIKAAILRRFPSQEYAVMFEVGNATGASARRYADAIVMSLWPSRGLDLHGIEIKVSRSDYVREAADPRKAESVARYCDKWSLYVAPGVVRDVLAVPPAWGVEEFDGASFRTLKKAEKTDAEPLTRGFVAAMLRRGDAVSRDEMREFQDRARQMAEDALAGERKAIETRVAAEVEKRTKAMAKMTAARERLLSMTGVDISGSQWEVERLWRAVPLALKLHEAGLHDSRYSGIGCDLRKIKQSVDDCLDVLAGIAAQDSE